ncbi:oligosaccharide flippase family protein, partial [Vibrio breoganii]|uniref:oligosaccharide flippase family protein n=1 Tax=Vibrio breoganii TaxID=553239 RepID=UPI0012FFF2BA
KYLGLSSLAIYDKSYTVMKYPLQLLSRAVTPALLPVLKDYKADRELILKTHINLIKTALLFGGIISFLISTNSELIVYLLLGNQWSEVVPVISVLAISIPMQLTTSFNGAFWQTFGNTKSQFKISIFTAVFTILVVTTSVFIEPTLSFITLAVTCSLNITCFNALLR